MTPRLILLPPLERRLPPVSVRAGPSVQEPSSLQRSYPARPHRKETRRDSAEKSSSRRHNPPAGTGPKSGTPLIWFSPIHQLSARVRGRTPEVLSHKSRRGHARECVALLPSALPL